MSKSIAEESYMSLGHVKNLVRFHPVQKNVRVQLKKAAVQRGQVKCAQAVTCWFLRA